MKTAKQIADRARRTGIVRIDNLLWFSLRSTIDKAYDHLKKSAESAGADIVLDLDLFQLTVYPVRSDTSCFFVFEWNNRSDLEPFRITRMRTETRTDTMDFREVL